MLWRSRGAAAVEAGGKTCDLAGRPHTEQSYPRDADSNSGDLPRVISSSMPGQESSLSRRDMLLMSGAGSFAASEPLWPATTKTEDRPRNLCIRFVQILLLTMI